ncbi:MAG: N-acetyltransferase [Desulfarculus sp.]|nr:MAG: N-acetyltransferase [Desulfarculus sp.]
MQILLVNPPLAGPAAPPRALARAAGALRGLGLRPALWDASLEYWLQELLGPRPEAASPLAVLRGQSFWQPEHYLSAEQEIQRLLAAAGRPWAPARFTWQGLEHPGLTSLAQAAAWAGDQARNPLYGFLARGLEARLGPETSLLVLSLAAPGQWLGALSLAAAARRLRPKTRVALLGPALPPAGGPFHYQLAGPGELLRLAAELAGQSAPERPAAAPDFSGLPLDQYLSPEPVTELGPVLWAQRQGEGEGLKALAQAGVRLVRWRLEEGGAAPPAERLAALRRLLRAAARAGLWSHLQLPRRAPEALLRGLLRLLGLNPHLAHSWSPPPAWPWSPAPAAPLRADIGGYSQLPPLPGRPLWQALAEPAHLSLYLARHGCPQVSRWRVRADGRSVYTLGRGVTYHFHPPSEVPKERLEEIAQLVLAGGRVRPKWLRHNLARAYVVGWAEEEGVLVGTDTLKRPRPEYLAVIKSYSGMDLTGYTERGYISVRPEYRSLGLGGQLIKQLVARAGGLKMFVIVGRDNPSGEQVLAHNQTRLVTTYYSHKMGKEMGIWMPVDQEPPPMEEALRGAR